MAVMHSWHMTHVAGTAIISWAIFTAFCCSVICAEIAQLALKSYNYAALFDGNKNITSTSNFMLSMTQQQHPWGGVSQGPNPQEEYFGDLS